MYLFNFLLTKVMLTQYNFYFIQHKVLTEQLALIIDSNNGKHTFYALGVSVSY